VRVVTGGADSIFESAGNLPFMTDIQADGYVLMDCAYSRLVPEFEPALAAIVTVATSRPGRPLVVDAGTKRMSTDWSEPVLADYQATHFATSEEHSRFLLSGTSRPQVGKRVAVIPGHSCSTVGFRRSMLEFRENRFERVLRFDASDQLDD
jgi:D-serine deaminase-like pyridoxal phosphate-dependent protein